MHEKNWIKNDWKKTMKNMDQMRIFGLIMGIVFLIILFYFIITLMNNEGFGWKVILFLGIFISVFISLIAIIIYYYVILLKYHTIAKIKVCEDHLDYITVKNWKGRIGYKDIELLDIIGFAGNHEMLGRAIYFYDHRRKRKSVINLTKQPFYEFLSSYKEWVKKTGSKEALIVTDSRLCQILWPYYKKGKLDKLKQHMEKNRYESWE